MIFQTLERRPVELGITDDVTRRVDESDAVPGRDARFICQGVGVHSRSPFGRQEPRLAREIVGRLIGNARVDLVVDDDHNGYDHDRDDRERLKEQPVREPHDRSLTFRMR